MFRSCQIIIRELCCSLLKLHYNIHNLIRFCKQGVVAACRVVFLHNMTLCLHTNTNKYSDTSANEDNSFRDHIR